MERGTYAIELVFECDLELLHGIEDDAEGCEDVVEDDGAPFFLFVLGEALGVDEAHLLQDSGFSALAGTWESHANVSRGNCELRKEEGGIGLWQLAGSWGL